MTAFALMSACLLVTGLVRQKEPGSQGKQHVEVAGIQTNYLLPVPFLHNQSERDPRLQEGDPKPETALFNFAWLTAPGSAVLASAILSMLLLRMNGKQVWWVLERTCIQMKIPIPTIAFMLGLSYVTRYAGMDATLGLAFTASEAARTATGRFVPADEDIAVALADYALHAGRRRAAATLLEDFLRSPRGATPGARLAALQEKLLGPAAPG